MGLVCYKNGSLTREDIRNTYADKSWNEFNKAMQSTEIGNNSNIGFYFKQAEITPKATGYYRFAPKGEVDTSTFKEVDHFTPQEEVRGVVEGQFLSMRLHAANIGRVFCVLSESLYLILIIMNTGMTKFSSILATGGGSSNEHLTRVMADVFGVPVFVASTANSASLGAAYRAFHGWLCHKKESFVTFK